MISRKIPSRTTYPLRCYPFYCCIPPFWRQCGAVINWIGSKHYLIFSSTNSRVTPSLEWTLWWGHSLWFIPLSMHHIRRLINGYGVRSYCGAHRFWYFSFCCLWSAQNRESRIVTWKRSLHRLDENWFILKSEDWTYRVAWWQSMGRWAVHNLGLIFSAYCLQWWVC